MISNSETKSVSAVTSLFAYILSITISSFIFSFFMAMNSYFNFENATTNSDNTKALHLIVIFAIVFLFSWISAVLVTAIPCLILLKFVHHFKIKTWIFYLFVGGLIGGVASMVYVIFFNIFGWYTDSPDQNSLSVMLAAVKIGQILVPSGALSGISFWIFSARKKNYFI
ncbi:hypothetical protein [Robbsia andropogonis]|uniref:hypothetical protein n=1 Tax=Robbsia andropogonis TaxID=28092 RepID=UPI00209E28AF|nr:hypothetical protein [Robbsia andropogonis]MCP1121439.1 hypothetical protein [Robbsia andropogonis]MCP1131230.1 hypothetical protein [Robbsia andropogonis]